MKSNYGEMIVFVNGRIEERIKNPTVEEIRNMDSKYPTRVTANQSGIIAFWFY